MTSTAPRAAVPRNRRGRVADAALGRLLARRGGSVGRRRRWRRSRCSTLGRSCARATLVSAVEDLFVRIRLLVAGGSYPRWERNLGTGGDPATSTAMVPSRRTIDPAGSRRLLPIRA